MQKIYLKIFIGIIILLWTMYLMQIYIVTYKKETFMGSLYRHYIRKTNKEYESFVNNYGPNVIITK
jgi:hypothetical protein